MQKYTVIGYEKTTRLMIVEADSEEEAIERAWNGEYSDVDTEPGPKCDKEKWSIE